MERRSPPAHKPRTGRPLSGLSASSSAPSLFRGGGGRRTGVRPAGGPCGLTPVLSPPGPAGPGFHFCLGVGERRPRGGPLLLRWLHQQHLHHLREQHHRERLQALVPRGVCVHPGHHLQQRGLLRAQNRESSAEPWGMSSSSHSQEDGPVRAVCTWPQAQPCRQGTSCASRKTPGPWQPSSDPAFLILAQNTN